MVYVYALIFGIVVAFFGILLPGLLNMTAVSISVKRGKRAGLIFASGMAVTTSFQAFIAFGSADYLRQNGDVLENLRIFALLLFIILALVFTLKGKSGKAIQTKPISGRKHFGGGMFMGMLNALSILYFFAVGTLLASRNLVSTGFSSVAVFSLGAGVGAFLMFYLYVIAADWISENAVWFTRNMNYIIGIFFALLACVQAYHMYGNHS